MTDPLERRLSDLVIAVPQTVAQRALAAHRDASAVASAPPAAGRRLRAARRPLVAAALAPAVLVAGTLGTAYYAPAYGQALADAPALQAVSGPLLRAMGLAGARLTELQQVSTSSGHELRLVAGYADPIRTVLFLRVDGAALGTVPGPPDAAHTYRFTATLRDQFGHTYAAGHAAAGGSALELEPLAPPASLVGARLTLHVSEIATLDGSTRYRGDWELHFTLAQSPGRTLPTPAPVRAGGLTYTFHSVTWAPNVLQVDYSIRGGATGEWLGELPAFLTIDGTGGDSSWSMAMTSVMEDASAGVRIRLTVVIDHPGRYGLTTAAGSPPLAWIVVPASPGAASGGPAPASAPASGGRQNGPASPARTEGR